MQPGPLLHIVQQAARRRNPHSGVIPTVLGTVRPVGSRIAATAPICGRDRGVGDERTVLASPSPCHPHAGRPAERRAGPERAAPAKWRFRLAPDLIVQLQPANKQTRRVPRAQWAEVESINRSDIFGRERILSIEALMIEDTLVVDGVAIVGPEDVTSFDKKPTGNPAPWAWLAFGIYADVDDAWTFELRNWTAKRDAVVGNAIERVHAALNPETFTVFKPEMMLSPRCLCCGKPLKDPASLARWIGPECAGTSSLTVPRVFLGAFTGGAA